LAEIGVAPETWIVLLAATSLVCLAAAVSARGLPVPHETLQALAVGIVLAVLVQLVPRLTGDAAVGLALVVRNIAAPDLRAPMRQMGQW
jgi:hypothetical protein